MFDKKILKKSLIWSLLIQVIILIFLLLNNISLNSLFSGEIVNFIEITLPFTFIIFFFLSLTIIPYSNFNSIFLHNFWIDLLFCFLSNLILFFILFIFVYAYFGKKYSLEKNRFLKFSFFIKKFWFLWLILIFFFNYLIIFLFSFYHNFPDLSFKEYRYCIKAEEIDNFCGFKFTTKGVCVKEDFCKNFEPYIQCENLNNSEGYKIVKNLKKENLSCKNTKTFDFYFINNNSIILNNTYKFKLENVDLPTFQYLGGKYSKDKNHIYYKSEIISADPETFIYEKRTGKVIGRGKDKNGIWIKGVLQK